MDTDLQQLLRTLSDQAIILLPFVALLGLALVAAIYRRPAIGAFLILLSAPLEGVLMVSGNSIVKMATLLCVLLFVARILLITRGFTIDSVTLFLLAFVAWTYVSIIWSPEQSSSLSNWISFALSTSLYLVLINFVVSRDDLRLVIWGHVIGGSILALMLISVEVAQAFQRKEEVAGLGLNLAARLTALTTLLSVYLFQSEPAKYKQIVLLAATVVSVIASVVSLSRGAWVSLFLAIAALLPAYLLTRRFKMKLSYVVIALVVGLSTLTILNRFVLDEHGVEKLAVRFQDGITLRDDAGGRLDIWLVGFNMFADAPLHGHGYNSFGYYYNYYSGTGSAGIPTAEESKAPHNAFVGVLVQFGLIGFVLFVAVLISAFRKSWVTWKRGNGDVSALAWVSALAVFLIVANFVDYAVDRKYLWYVLAIITLIARYESAPVTASLPQVASKPAHPTTILTLEGSRANR